MFVGWPNKGPTMRHAKSEITKRPEGHPCAACEVRQWGICEPLSDEELGIVEKIKDGERIIPSGTDFIGQGEPLREAFTVIDGWGMEYRLLDDGRRQIGRIFLPGDLIGFEPDMAAVSDAYAQALTDLTLCVFPRDRLNTVYRSHADLPIRMASMIARDRSRTDERLTMIGRMAALERVAHFLLEIYLRIRLRSHEPLGWEIVVPMTQVQIGDAIGLTPVHVNRMLRELREKGLLSFADQKMSILDPDGLAELAGFDQDSMDRMLP